MDIKKQIDLLGPWHYAHIIQGYPTGDSLVESTHPKLVELRHAGAFQRKYYPKVLDLGANSGIISMWFVDNTASHVDAIEFSPLYFPQLEFAIKYKGYETSITPIFKDISLGDFGVNKYHLILFLGTMHHLKKETHSFVLEECRKALLPGGEIVVQTDSKLPVFELMKQIGFINVRKLNCNWHDRIAFEALKDPMKLHD